MVAMSAPRSKWLASAQLLRLPNLFTAVADPLAGWLIVGGEPRRLPWVLGASACLYAAGIVFNVCLDYQRDCVERPERPLPRGEISLTAASVLGAVLLGAGLVLGGWIALPLAILILFYDSLAKRSAWSGPLTLGGCRLLNMGLGMGGLEPVAPAIILGIYVTVLSFIARREEIQPSLRRIVKHLLLGIIVLDAVLVLAFTGNWLSALLVLSLLPPAWALSRILAMT
jgi:4-hydroxybenzoate polyprenyltransferase